MAELHHEDQSTQMPRFARTVRCRDGGEDAGDRPASSTGSQLSIFICRVPACGPSRGFHDVCARVSNRGEADEISSLRAFPAVTQIGPRVAFRHSLFTLCAGAPRQPATQPQGGCCCGGRRCRGRTWSSPPSAGCRPSCRTPRGLGRGLRHRRGVDVHAFTEAAEGGEESPRPSGVPIAESSPARHTPSRVIACDACRFPNAVAPLATRLTAPFRWNIATYDRGDELENACSAITSMRSSRSSERWVDFQ